MSKLITQYNYLVRSGNDVFARKGGGPLASASCPPPPPLAAPRRAMMGVPRECLEVDREAATEGAVHGHGFSMSCVGKLFNSLGKSCINLIKTF